MPRKLRILTVSIITPVKNAADTVKSCLDSVHRQDYPVEHIVVDGGSTDGTLPIVRDRHSGITRLVSEEDAGMYEALNKGLALARGDVVGILNADDFYADNQVISDVAAFFETSAVDSCYGDLVYVDRVDSSKVVRFWKSRPFRRELFRYGWMPPNPTFFFRRSVYERYGGFNTSLGSSADYELMLRYLHKYGIASAYLPRLMVVMRTGGMSNASLSNRMKAHRWDRKAWKVNGLHPRPWTLLAKPFSKMGQYFFANLRVRSRYPDWYAEISCPIS